MVKILIVGDPHLGGSLSLGRVGLGSQINSRIIDRFNILDWVLQQAIERNVSDLVITGDEYEDAKPPPFLVAMFIDWLRRCSDAGIHIHLIMGNHGLLRSGQHYSCALDLIATAEIPGIFIYKDIASLDLPGISLTFLPFRDRRSLNTNSNQEAIQIIANRIRFECLGLDNRNIKVAIGHLALPGSLPESDELLDNMTNELFPPLEIFNNYNYTLMGHVHKQQILQEKPYIAHLGSMDISNWGEHNQRKFLALIDPAAEQTLQLIDIPCRQLKSISLTVPSTTTDTTSFLLEQLKTKKLNLSNAIIKLHIFLESPELMNADKNALEQYLYQLGAFYVPRIDQERKIAQIKKHTGTEQLDNTITEISAIKLYASTNIETAQQNDFISLASSIVQETNNAAT